MPTIAEAIAEGARRLAGRGVDEARRTAGVLLGHALGVDRTHLLVRSDEEVDEARCREYLALVDRRAAGEPLQYVTGRQEFYGLDFAVTPDVLIPRPETEFLVERVIRLALAEEARVSNPLIVDAGTGSGCIAVTLAARLPRARVIAIDVSGAAIDVARLNAARHGVADRVEFVEGDMLGPLKDFDCAIDYLVSNPPYVPDREIERLQPEVRDWEPRPALAGGAEGLDFYRRLLADGFDPVKPGGYFICEIGYNQLDPLREMIAASGWDVIEVTDDLQGIPRTLTLRKR